MTASGSSLGGRVTTLHSEPNNSQVTVPLCPRISSRQRAFHRSRCSTFGRKQPTRAPYPMTLQCDRRSLIPITIIDHTEVTTSTLGDRQTYGTTLRKLRHPPYLWRPG